MTLKHISFKEKNHPFGYLKNFRNSKNQFIYQKSMSDKSKKSITKDPRPKQITTNSNISPNPQFRCANYGGKKGDTKNN